MTAKKTSTALKNAAKKVDEATPVIGLAKIVASGASGMYTSPEVHAPLVEAGFVEINPNMTNEAGEIATRATHKGIEEMQTPESTVTEAVAAPVTEAKGFKIEDGIPAPTSVGRSRGGNVYPFDELEPGQSFFVKATEDRPNPAKALASTVSSATARYAVPCESGATKLNKKGETVPVMVKTREFAIRKVEGGARIWRIA